MTNIDPQENSALHAREEHGFTPWQEPSRRETPVAETQPHAKPRARRGFAAMDQEQQRQIASQGGRAVSKNRQHMATIGREGGRARRRPSA